MKRKSHKTPDQLESKLWLDVIIFKIKINSIFSRIICLFVHLIFILNRWWVPEHIQAHVTSK